MGFPSVVTEDAPTLASPPPSGRHGVARASGVPARAGTRHHHRLMGTTRQLTAVIGREDNAYVALCPELDIASQGDTVEVARRNLIEALELFLESADPTEVSRRLHSEVFVTRVEVPVG